MSRTFELEGSCKGSPLPAERTRQVFLQCARDGVDCLIARAYHAGLAVKDERYALAA